MNKRVLRSVIFVSFFLISLFSSVLVYANEKDSTVSAKLVRGGSFEVFWPLTAGKTINDPLYFLKTWKEDINGIFIFNTARKADYEVTLSTKRILEVEKLMKDGKEDLAIKTSDKALAQLNLARGKFSKATKEGKDFDQAKINLINQLSNLDAFLPRLIEMSSGGLQNKNVEVSDVVEKFLNDVVNP